MSLFGSPLPVARLMNSDVEQALTIKWLMQAGKHSIDLTFLSNKFNLTRDDCRTNLDNLARAEATAYVVDESINTRLVSSDLYKAKSALQKAIRKGDVNFAQKAAHAMLTSADPSSYWRRISMIALEDIGLADPYAAGLALTLCSNKKLRDEVGWKKAGFWIADVLASAPKSRDLTHLLVYLGVSPWSKTSAVAELENRKPESLVELSLDEASPLFDRLAAFVTLTAGGFEIFSKKTENYASPYRKEVINKMDLPPLIRFLMIQGRRNGAWCLDAAIPFAWRLLCASDQVVLRHDPFDTPCEIEKIGSAHAASLDQYTLVGKRALGYFKKANEHVAKAIAPMPVKNHTDIIGEAVFYAEGGIVRPWLTWKGSEELWSVLLMAWFNAKGANHDDALNLILTIQKELPYLQSIRRKFLAQ